MKNIFMRALACVLMAMLIFASSGITASAPEKILGSGVSTDEAGTSDTYSGSYAIYNKNEWQVLARTNAIRLSMGIPALTTFSGMQQACDLREEELTRLMDHFRPDGRTCFTALDDLDVPYTRAGENIAGGYESAASVVDAWMNSPGHRANMLDPGFTHMGVGYLQKNTGYRHFWVQMFCGWYSERTKKISLENTEHLFVKRGTKISDMGIVLHAENSVYGDCVAPLIDEMCTGYNPNMDGTQTVTASFDGFDVEFTVNVSETGAGVTLDKYSAKVLLGSSLQLNAVVHPENTPGRSLTWTSSDENVAIVDECGLVTPVGRGKCAITAKTVFGTSATCNIEVTIKKVTSLKFDTTKYAVTLKKGDSLGETFQINATIKPKKASIKKLKWKSSNTDVATVDENGLVTIVGFGKCTITACTTDGTGKKASCAVTVQKKQVTSIALKGKKTMKVGSTQTLIATIKPKNAFDQTLRWKSNKPDVISVDENGVVTALKKGTATITCIAQDGSKVKAKLKIKVK